MSGRLVCLLSLTVNWLTASQSSFSGSSKSITLAWAPAMDPSGRRYSTVTPFTSRRWSARLRASSVGPSDRVSLRKASSSASGGNVGLSRVSA
jgi:hypothetical protein